MLISQSQVSTYLKLKNCKKLSITKKLQLKNEYAASLLSHIDDIYAALDKNPTATHLSRMLTPSLPLVNLVQIL